MNGTAERNVIRFKHFVASLGCARVWRSAYNSQFEKANQASVSQPVSQSLTHARTGVVDAISLRIPAFHLHPSRSSSTYTHTDKMGNSSNPAHKAGVPRSGVYPSPTRKTASAASASASAAVSTVALAATAASSVSASMTTSPITASQSHRQRISISVSLERHRLRLSCCIQHQHRLASLPSAKTGQHRRKIDR